MSFLTGEVSTALALLTPPLYCCLASPHPPPSAHVCLTSPPHLPLQVACANVVAELDCQISQIRAANIEGMLTSEGAASQATFY